MPAADEAIPKVPRVSSRVAVETPEQIRFDFELAGVAPRLLAYLLDLLIRAGIVSVLALVLGMIVGWASAELATGLILVILFAIEWGYHTLLEWLWNGATPGKKALGIRVVRADGVGLDFTRSALRNLLRAADIFPLFYAAGLATMILGGRQRRLGDLAAGTMVVRVERARLAALPPLPTEATPLPPGTLRELGLRSRDVTLIDGFFRRRQLLSAERARELAGILAGPVARRLGLPEGGDPELLLAGILLAGHEVRASWPGRDSAFSRAPARGGAF
ncbi:MAG TPA: RDD family protein [Polyangia bacterium]|nr:RDD family protein [Polyangia bacterium]